MVSYRLIGTGTTNAQGIARCSNNYVGTGKGEVDIVASTDNPIVEGSLLSETYEVIDAFIVDSGITGTYNTGGLDSGLTNVDVTDTGTLLENTSTSNARRIMNNASVGSDGNDITSAFTIEFDIVSLNGRVGFNFYQTSGTNITNYSSDVLGITAPCHFKMVHDGNKFSIWIDDTKKVNNVSHIWNSGRFMILLYGSLNTSFKYKNFVVYPI